MALVEDVEHALHRLGARDVRLVRAAVEVVRVGRRRLQPRHDRADPLAGRDVVVDDRGAGRAGDRERERADDAGAVLAGRAVDDRGAVGVRGVAQRVDDRVGAVAQVAEVGAHGGRLDARAVAVAAALDPRHHRGRVDVGVLAGLGVERAVADLGAAVARRAGPGPRAGPRRRSAGRRRRGRRPHRRACRRRRGSGPGGCRSAAGRRGRSSRRPPSGSPPRSRAFTAPSRLTQRPLTPPAYEAGPGRCCGRVIAATLAG